MSEAFLWGLLSASSLLLGGLVALRFRVGSRMNVGERIRFVVLGRMSSILPRPEHDLLRLNLDAVGIFDFDQGTAAPEAFQLENRRPVSGPSSAR